MSAATDRNKQAMKRGAAVMPRKTNKRGQSMPLKQRLKNSGLKPGNGQ